MPYYPRQEADGTRYERRRLTPEEIESARRTWGKAADPNFEYTFTIDPSGRRSFSIDEPAARQAAADQSQRKRTKQAVENRRNETARQARQKAGARKERTNPSDSGTQRSNRQTPPEREVREVSAADNYADSTGMGEATTPPQYADSTGMGKVMDRDRAVSPSSARQEAAPAATAPEGESVFGLGNLAANIVPNVLADEWSVFPPVRGRFSHAGFPAAPQNATVQETAPAAESEGGVLSTLRNIINNSVFRGLADMGWLRPVQDVNDELRDVQTQRAYPYQLDQLQAARDAVTEAAQAPYSDFVQSADIDRQRAGEGASAAALASTAAAAGAAQSVPIPTAAQAGAAQAAPQDWRTGIPTASAAGAAQTLSPTWRSPAAERGVAQSVPPRYADESLGGSTAVPQPMPNTRMAPVEGNIDLYNRPIQYNPDGSYSTLGTATYQTQLPDGGIGYVNLPTVGSTDPYADYVANGQHLGIYPTQAQALQAAEQLHNDQAAYYDPIVADQLRRGARSGDFNQVFPELTPWDRMVKFAQENVTPENLQRFWEWGNIAFNPFYWPEGIPKTGPR